MKNITKTSTFALSTLLASVVLAGCGGPKTTVQFWTGFGSNVSEVLENLIGEFEKANPGIKVAHEGKGGYDNLQAAINLSVSSETYPHVAVGYPDHFAGYISSNIQLPLDPYIAEEDSNFLADFYPDYMLENQSLVYKRDANNQPDKTQPYTMGLPFNKSTEVMVVNKTFFNWVKTKDATIEVPVTWQEVQTVGTKIINVLTTGNYFNTEIKDGNTLILDLKGVTADVFRPIGYDSGANFFITAVRQWGGVYTEMGPDIRTGYIRFNSQATKNALTFFENMYNTGVIGLPANWGEASYSSAPFKAVKTVMTISSSAGVTNNVPAGNLFEVDVRPVPYNADGPKFVISQGTNLAMFDRGTEEEKLAAWKLIKFLTTEANDRFAQGTSYFPVTKAMSDSAFYTSFLNAPDASLTSTEKAIKASANVNSVVYDAEASTWTKFVDPGFVGSSRVRTEVGNIMGLLFNEEGVRGTVDGVLAYVMNQLSDYAE